MTLDLIPVGMRRAFGLLAALLLAVVAVTALSSPSPIDGDGAQRGRSTVSQEGTGTAAPAAPLATTGHADLDPGRDLDGWPPLATLVVVGLLAERAVSRRAAARRHARTGVGPDALHLSRAPPLLHRT